MNTTEIKTRLESDPYFINLRRFDFDIRKLEARYENEPSGVPDHVIASALQVDESVLPSWYSEVAERLQKIMGVQE